MLADNSIIQNDFKPLNGKELIETVKERMKLEELTTLPVVDETTQKLIGQVELNQLSKFDGSLPVSELELIEPVKLYRGQHIFEAARLMLQHELRMLPVVDREMAYQGILNKQEVLESLSRMLNLAEFGSVITVEIEQIDYSISEIVQIIETEGAKILGVTVEKPGEVEQKFEVSFKLNIKDVSRVVAALRRYDYTVLAQSESTVFGEDLEKRADELLKYIDM